MRLAKQRLVRWILMGTVSFIGMTIGLHECISDEALAKPSSVSIDKGRQLFEKQRCTVCHREGGLGKPLAGVGTRLKREEVRAWIADPKKIKPKTIMPKLPLKEDELDAVTDYVMSLK